MTKPSMNLAELLEKHDDGDFLRAIAEAVLQLIMETDVEGVIGAGRHERAEGHSTRHDTPSSHPASPNFGHSSRASRGAQADHALALSSNHPMGAGQGAQLASAEFLHLEPNS